MAYPRRRGREAAPIRMKAKFASTCYGCGAAIALGDEIVYRPVSRKAYALTCEYGCGYLQEKNHAEAEAKRQGDLEDEDAHERMYGDIVGR